LYSSINDELFSPKRRGFQDNVALRAVTFGVRKNATLGRTSTIRDGGGYQAGSKPRGGERVCFFQDNLAVLKGVRLHMISSKEKAPPLSTNMQDLTPIEN